MDIDLDLIESTDLHNSPIKKKKGTSKKPVTEANSQEMNDGIDNATNNSIKKKNGTSKKPDTESNSQKMNDRENHFERGRSNHRGNSSSRSEERGKSRGNSRSRSEERKKLIQQKMDHFKRFCDTGCRGFSTCPYSHRIKEKGKVINKCIFGKECIRHSVGLCTYTDHRNDDNAFLCPDGKKCRTAGTTCLHSHVHFAPCDYGEICHHKDTDKGCVFKH